MKKKHLIALVIAAVVVAAGLPLGYFDFDLSAPWKPLAGMIIAIIGALVAIMYGSHEPSDSHSDHH